MSAITDAMTAWLQAEHGLAEDMVVVSYEDDTVGDGYCETCYYEYSVIVFEAKSTTSSEVASVTVRGNFADTIQKLEQYSD